MFKAKVVEENCSINELRSKIGRWMKIAKGKRLLAVAAIKKSTTLISASWLACLNLRWGWRKLRLRLRYRMKLESEAFMFYNLYTYPKISYTCYKSLARLKLTRKWLFQVWNGFFSGFQNQVGLEPEFWKAGL